MLSEIFGFDRYEDITSEYSIRGTYCDLAVKHEENIKFLVEAKAIGLELKEIHIRQAINYGVQHGIQLVILTNGVCWNIYRLTFEKSVSYELLTSFDFLELNPRKSETLDTLFLLCKEGLSKDVLEKFYEHIKSVNRYMIGAILQTDAALGLIRRELRRVSPKIRVDFDEIASILTGEVLKREVITGDEAEHSKVMVKKAANRKLTKQK